MANQKKSKKLKHNKKRNTAFLFEALVKELTKASIANDVKKRKAISSILKKHFKKSGVLFRKIACLFHGRLHGCTHKMSWVADAQNCVRKKRVLGVFTHLPQRAVYDHVLD